MYIMPDKRACIAANAWESIFLLATPIAETTAHHPITLKIASLVSLIKRKDTSAHSDSVFLVVKSKAIAFSLSSRTLDVNLRLK
jgi:hypothetical protein